MRVIETQIKDPQMSLWHMEMWSLEVGVSWPKSELCHFILLFLICIFILQCRELKYWCIRLRVSYLKVRYVHIHQGESAGPPHTPEYDQACWEISLRRAETQEGLPKTRWPWMRAEGLCLPDRTLKCTSLYQGTVTLWPYRITYSGYKCADLQLK